MEPQVATVPMGEYRTYRAAKRAVDQLQVVGRIPGRRIALRGRELRWREPLNGERALARGAAFGAVLGAVVGAGLPETGFVEVGEFVVLVPEDDAPRAREVLGAPAGAS
jgi:hypothetical protein